MRAHWFKLLLIAGLLSVFTNTRANDPTQIWYYHWNCNGDAECIYLNSGVAKGTYGPESGGYAGCYEQIELAATWNGPGYWDACDNSPTSTYGPPVYPPTLASFSLQSGSPGTTVTITGSNLSNATVTINGIPVTVVSSSANQIVFTIPAMGNFTGPITVTTTGGSVVSSIAFTVKNNFAAVAWSGTTLVAVGDNGTIASSADGIAWTAQTSGTVQSLYAVAWSGTRFVAVGSGGIILSSPDGMTWTSRASGTTNNLFGIASSGTQLVVVGGTSALPATSYVVGGTSIILTSTDGINWTTQTSSTKTLVGVAWSGSRYIAVGPLTSPSQVVLVSADGISWTPHQWFTPFGADGGPGAGLIAVTWAGTRFVAASSGITSSADGTSWTTPVYVANGLNLTALAWSGTQTVAVGANGLIFTSPDGATWTSRSSGLTIVLNGSTASQAINLSGITWTGTRFVAVGGKSTILVSPDGITWSLATTAMANRSDCIFNWGEKQYPQYFSTTGVSSGEFPPYHYRYYTGTKNYLASSSVDNSIYVLGPGFGGKLVRVGSVASFLTLAGCE